MLLRPFLRLARAAFLLIASVGALAGLAGCERPRPAERVGRGVLIGRVRLAPDQLLPEYGAIDLQRAPMRSDGGSAPPECAAANQRARRPVALTADGSLSGIVVAASDFTHTKIGAVKPKHHRVVIRHCQLEPAVVAARHGDWLEIENQDEFAFSPLLGPAFRPKPLARGERLKIPIAGGRVDALLCTPHAPCGRSDIVSFHHPVFALTDRNGHFRIPAFPDSELVRITAWHPLFEPAENYAWVEPGQTGSVELVMTPKARFVPKTNLALKEKRRAP